MLTSNQSALLAYLQLSASDDPPRCIVYCTEYLGYLPFGLYHWVEIDGQQLDSRSLAPNFSQQDLDALETAGLIDKINRMVNAEDELESRTTYVLSKRPKQQR